MVCMHNKSCGDIYDVCAQWYCVCVRFGKEEEFPGEFGVFLHLSNV
jgi:hypothetical protein